MCVSGPNTLAANQVFTGSNPVVKSKNIIMKSLKIVGALLIIAGAILYQYLARGLWSQYTYMVYETFKRGWPGLIIIVLGSTLYITGLVKSKK